MEKFEIESLFAELYKKARPATLEAYKHDLSTFAAYMGTQSSEQAVEQLLVLPNSQADLTVLHYKSQLCDQKLAISTVNRKISTLRSVINTAFNLQLIDWRLDIKNEKSPSKQASTDLCEKAISNLFNICKKQKNPKKAARDFAILRLMHDLALKRHLIAALQLEDYDDNSSTLHMQPESYKPGMSKKLPFVTKKALNEWLKLRGEGPGYLFFNLDNAKKGSGLSPTSIYRVVRDLGKKCGLKLFPDQIRQYAIRLIIERAEEIGIDEREILSFSDHKHLSSLKRLKKQKQQNQKTLSDWISNQN